jgi:hypothetical protein
MHDSWGNLHALMMKYNPSSCFLALPLMTSAFNYNANQSTIGLCQAVRCECGPGYVGPDYCVAAPEAFIPVPSIVTAFSNVTIYNPSLPGGNFTFVGLQYYLRVMDEQMASAGNFSYSLALASNMVFGIKVPLHVYKVPKVLSVENITIQFVVSAFALDPTSITYVNCFYYNKCAPSSMLPRAPETILEWQTSLYAPLDEQLVIDMNPNVPTNLTFDIQPRDPLITETFNLNSSTRITGLFRDSGMKNFSVYAYDSYSTEYKQVATIQINVTDCPRGNNLSYACHLHGFCQDDGDPYNTQFTCNCLGDYEGTYCDKDAPSTQTVTSVTIIGMSLGVGVGLVLIIVIMYLMNRRRLQRRDLEKQSLEEKLLSSDNVRSALEFEGNHLYFC